MNEVLKVLGKIISKITLSFTYSSKGKERSKKDKGQSVNNYGK